MAAATVVLTICMAADAKCTGDPASPAGYLCTFAGHGANHVGKGNLKFSKKTDPDSKVTITLQPDRFQLARPSPVKIYENNKSSPYLGPVFGAQTVTDDQSVYFMDWITREDDKAHLYLYGVTVTDTQTSTPVVCDPTISHN
jgi:hypothetical protein